VRGVTDHRVDVYGLGATLYELLTLEPALPGDDGAELRRRLIAADPVPPRAIDPSIPADLETVVLKALRKEPGERYATAQELAEDLRRFWTVSRCGRGGRRCGRGSGGGGVGTRYGPARRWWLWR